MPKKKKAIHPLREAEISLNLAAKSWRDSCSDTTVIELIDSSLDIIGSWLKDNGGRIQLKRAAKKFSFDADKNVGLHSNGTRASIASDQCYHFALERKLLSDNAKDIITNMGHLSDREGWDFEEVLRVARNHWLTER